MVKCAGDAVGIKNADGRDNFFSIEVGGLLNCGNVGKDCRLPYAA